MDKVAELMVLSMKRAVFMDERIAQKRDTPRKDVSIKLLSISGLTNFVCFPPSHLGKTSKLDCTRFVVGYLLSAVATSTAQATVQPTIGLLPMPRNPIISTCAGTDEEPANCASECIRPIVSVTRSDLNISICIIEY